MRAAIRLAGGREVCFVCTLDDGGHRTHRTRRRARRRARACSRCPASPSAARCSCTITRRACSSRRTRISQVAARMHDDGVGFGDHRQRRARAVRRRGGAARRARHATRHGRHRRGSRARMARSRDCCRSTRTVRPSASSPRRSRSSTTTAASDCSRQGTGIGKSLGLPHPGAAMGRGERRAHGRVHQHDQPAGTARRQGPAVSRARARRPAGAVRAAQGMAQLPVPDAARAGRVHGHRAVRGVVRQRARRTHRVGRANDGWLAQRHAGAAACGAVGRGLGRAGPVQSRAMRVLRQVLPVRGAAQGGAGRCDRRQPPPAHVGRRRQARSRRTGTTRRCCRRTRGSSSTKAITWRTPPPPTSAQP